VLPTMFFSLKCVANNHVWQDDLWKKIWLATHSGKNMIGSTFWGKTWLATHFREKNMVGSTFWEK
jgi:hypothetical protein